jgi:hypothetical protein
MTDESKISGLLVVYKGSNLDRQKMNEIHKMNENWVASYYIMAC